MPSTHQDNGAFMDGPIKGIYSKQIETFQRNQNNFHSKKQTLAKNVGFGPMKSSVE
jgi:hypothetical protein